MLRRNLRYKLLALALSIIIWACVDEGQNPQISKPLQAPVGIVHLDPDLVVLNAPNYVKVSLEGPRSHVDSILAKPKGVTAYIDLSGRTAGQHVVPVIVSVPQAYKSLVTPSATPGEAVVTLEDKVRRAIPIDVQFIGSPPIGYRFGPPRIVPDRAAVVGTAKRVSAVTRVVVAVDAGKTGLSGIDADVPLIPEDKNGNVVPDVEITPAKVHVHLALAETPASRIVFISPDVAGQPPFPCKVGGIEVAPQTISVTGPADQLGGVTTLRTEAISVSGRTSDFTQRVRVIAPRGLTVGANRYVRVTISIISTEQKAPASTPEKGN